MSTLPPNVIPLKAGIFGPQGVGKTTSAALLAAALSAEVYNRAPVMVLDPDLAWEFPKRIIFGREGIELITRTRQDFAGMVESMHEAEKLGCCVWIVDPLTLIWNELLKAFHAKTKGYMDYSDWAELKGLWRYDYTNLFLNSQMSCIACGRLGDVREDVQDEKNPEKLRSVKTGTQFKAGGSESFGYEPHLLIEMSIERKAKVKAGSRLEGEGRIIHRGDVLKDRTWALNGRVLRWSDKTGYVKGGYRQVWESIKPHFDEVQATLVHPTIAAGSTEDTFDDQGNGDYYRAQKLKAACLEDWDATMGMIWPGQTAAEKKSRMLAGEAITTLRSRTRIEQLDVAQLQHCVGVLLAVERRMKEQQPNSEAELLTLVELAKKDFTEGYQQMTLLEVMGRKSCERVAEQKPANGGARAEAAF